MFVWDYLGDYPWNPPLPPQEDGGTTVSDLEGP